MGISISGKGTLSGLASLVSGAINNLNLLITKIIGYTHIGGGAGSYYTTTIQVNDLGFIRVGTFGHTSYSGDGITWYTGNNLTNSYYWGLLPAAGNGTTVALSTDGQIAYSTDGNNWTFGSNLGNLGWTSLSFANNIFVAVAYFGETAYSTDGITWTLGNTISVSPWYSAPAFGNGVFSFINPDGYIAYSTDGMSWTLGNNIGAIDWTTSPTFANGIFVAINSDGNTAYSSDGITWSLGDSLTYANWHQPVFGNGIFVTNTSNGAISYSADGSTWTSGNTISSTGLQTLVFGNGVFVTNTSSGDTVYSLDGITWTFGNSLGSSDWYSTPAFYNGTFVLINSFGLSAYSTDGITWTLGNQLSGNAYNPVSAIIGQVSVFKETQVSIGDQGTQGAEILAPVDIYVVPEGKTTLIDKVTVKNNSLNTITYDLGVLDAGIELTDINALINDKSLSAKTTDIIDTISGSKNPGTRIIVFPSAVDVVEVKVYGTETLIPLNDFIGLDYRMNESNQSHNVVRMYLNNTQPVPTIGSTITISGSSYSGYNTTYEVASVNSDSDHGASKSVVLYASYGSNVGSGSFATGGLWT